MGDSSDINQLKDAEFKEAFDEFDTVSFDRNKPYNAMVNVFSVSWLESYDFSRIRVEPSPTWNYLG